MKLVMPVIALSLLALFMGGVLSVAALGQPSPAAVHMTLGGVGSVAAASPEMPGAVEGGAWKTVSVVSAAILGIGGLLLLLRRESRMTEPTAQRSISGGPVTVRSEKDHIERHEHDGFKHSIQKQLDDLWLVINELRQEMGLMQKGLGEQTVLREANGETLTEIRRDLQQQSALLHEVLGMMKTKGVRQ